MTSGISFHAVWGLGRAFTILGGDLLDSAFSTDFLHFLPLRDPTGQGGSTINALWGATPGLVYAVGSNGLVLKRKSTTEWKKFEGRANLGNLTGVWGTGNGTVYVGGNTGLWSSPESSEAAAWTPSITEPIVALWGTAPGESPKFAYALGEKVIYSHNMQSDDPWAKVRAPLPSDFQPTALWGQAPEHLIIVGKKGQICEGQASESFKCITTAGGKELLGVFGITDPVLGLIVYAVGKQGALVKRQALGRWATIDSQTTKDLWAIWGSEPENFIAVGADRTVICRTSLFSFRQEPPSVPQIRPRRRR